MRAIRRSARLFLLLLLVSGIAAGQTSLSTTSDGADASNQAIESAVKEIGSIDSVETPLKQVVETLQQQFRIPILLSEKKLEEASVSPDTPVTKTVFNLPLESLLWHVLHELELTYIVRDGVILITTPEDAESHLLTRVYPVLDLITPRQKQPTGYGGDYDSLIEVITATVKPDSWDDVGGPGAIDCLDNAAALVVSQTRDVHVQIEGLLTALRRAKSRQGIASVARFSASWETGPSREPTQATRRVATRPASSWQIPQAHPPAK